MERSNSHRAPPGRVRLGESGAVLAKLDEELKELAEARRQGSREKIEEETGDLLFVLVNLARLLKVDAEQGLRGTNAKFRARFGYLERKLALKASRWNKRRWRRWTHSGRKRRG